MHVGPFKNTLLQHLDSETITRLQLQRVQLPLLYQLERPGSSIDQIFFMEEVLGL